MDTARLLAIILLCIIICYVLLLIMYYYLLRIIIVNLPTYIFIRMLASASSAVKINIVTVTIIDSKICNLLVK